ncbi:unnamed protein product [Brassica rapa subsp. trilocularis]
MKQWKKGPARGKGGPQNALCKYRGNYRGVRQRTCLGGGGGGGGKVDQRTRLWLGSFSSDEEANMAYDEAALKLYGHDAYLKSKNIFHSLI